MKVIGDIYPETLSMESYFPLNGYVEIRLCENIKEITETDHLTKATVTMFEYDEYTFVLKDRVGLRQDIERHLDEWMATGRTVEVNESASIVQDMKAEITDTVAAMAAMVDDVYNQDMATIEEGVTV